MQIINVDLVPGKVMPILHASQFDKGRSLGVKLYNGGAVFELSGAEDLTAAVRKPDGNIVTETLTNAGGSLVEIITTEQMTACAGGSLCEIKIENAGDVFGTANFVLEVEKDPTDGGIESESEIDNLATQVAGLVASEVENQYDSANVIFDDEPTEGHGNGYTVKSEGIKRAVDNVQNAVNEVDDKADGNKTASGAIATFDTSLALPLQDCTIEINAVQTGTLPPSPSNVCPISGFTGADIAVYNENLFTSMATSSTDGITTSYDNTTGLISIENNSRTTNYISGSTRAHVATGLNSSHTYKYEIIPNVVGVTLIGDGTTVLSKDGFTGYAVADLRITNYYDFVNDHPIGSVTKVRLVLYDVTTGVLNTYPITWQSEAGTVYGGSLDVTTGVLTVDWFGVKPTDLTLDGYSTGSSSVCYRVNLVNNAISVSLISDKRGAKSNMSTENTAYFGVMRPNECDVNCFAITQAGNKIAIYDTDTTLTQAQFETKYSDMFIIYPLATPVTYQLTPTQISAIVGTNNIFTDTNGNTSVVFACSLKDYVGDLSQLTTSDKSSLVGAVNEVNEAISYKEYVVQIGTSLWNGVYYAETNVATDVSNYGEILSALVIDESEQSDFSSHTNRACFCQVITPNIIRLYSPQASNASGHYVKYRVTFSSNAVNRT